MREEDFFYDYSSQFNSLYCFQTIPSDMVTSAQFFVIVMAVFIDVSLFCFFGQEITSNYEEVFLSICSYWKWYEYPMSFQKHIPMILLNAEQPVYLKGYFGAYCTRDFIKSVCKPILIQKKFLKFCCCQQLNSAATPNTNTFTLTFILTFTTHTFTLYTQSHIQHTAFNTQHSIHTHSYTFTQFHTCHICH